MTGQILYELMRPHSRECQCTGLRMSILNDGIHLKVRRIVVVIGVYVDALSCSSF